MARKLEFTGLSTDTKPIDSSWVGDCSTYLELDTSIVWEFNAENCCWTIKSEISPLPPVPPCPPHPQPDEHRIIAGNGLVRMKDTIEIDTKKAKPNQVLSLDESKNVVFKNLEQVLKTKVKANPRVTPHEAKETEELLFIQIGDNNYRISDSRLHYFRDCINLLMLTQNMELPAVKESNRTVLTATKIWGRLKSSGKDIRLVYNYPNR